MSEVKDGFVPTTLWFRDEVGDNQEAKTEVKRSLRRNHFLLVMAMTAKRLLDQFGTPKPERLLKRVLEIATVKSELR